MAKKAPRSPEKAGRNDPVVPQSPDLSHIPPPLRSSVEPISDLTLDPKSEHGIVEEKRKPKHGVVARVFDHIATKIWSLVEPVFHLFADPANARTHSRKNLDAIKGSLRQFGQVSPLIVQDNTGVVRAGNGRLAAARELLAEGDERWSHMAVVRVPWDNATAMAFGIADNRTAELAEWDDGAVEKILREINVGDEDLSQMFADLAEDLELIVADTVDDPEEQPALEVPERFQVMVTCTDETHQKILLEELEGRGIECRAIVS